MLKTSAALDLFLSRVEKTSTCWLWKGPFSWGGYGALHVNGRTYVAHRWSYEHHVGPIPDGLQIDHLCRVRPCVNPEHLEPVTPRENTIRGVSIVAVNAAKTHCKRGHEFTPENTYIRTARSGMPARQCIECRRLDDRKRDPIRRAKAKRID